MLRPDDTSESAYLINYLSRKLEVKTPKKMTRVQRREIEPETETSNSRLSPVQELELLKLPQSEFLPDVNRAHGWINKPNVTVKGSSHFADAA